MVASLPVRLAMQGACAFTALVPALVRYLPSDDQVSRLAHLFWFVPSSDYFYALGTRHALEECVAWGTSFLVVVLLWIAILASREVAARLARVRLPLRRRLLILLLSASVLLFWMSPELMHDFSGLRYGGVDRLIDTNVVARGIFLYCMTVLNAMMACVPRLVFSRNPR